METVVTVELFTKFPKKVLFTMWESFTIFKYDCSMFVVMFLIVILNILFLLIFNGIYVLEKNPDVIFTVVKPDFQ